MCNYIYTMLYTNHRRYIDMVTEREYFHFSQIKKLILQFTSVGTFPGKRLNDCWSLKLFLSLTFKLFSLHKICELEIRPNDINYIQLVYILFNFSNNLIFIIFMFVVFQESRAIHILHLRVVCLNFICGIFMQTTLFECQQRLDNEVVKEIMFLR